MSHDDTRTGVERITVERKRQIEQEGWTPEHDAMHGWDTLALAAVCYATPPAQRSYRETVHGYDAVILKHEPIGWPWAESWWKPTPDDRIRELTKAGALIAAEIDRLLAKEAQA